MVMCFLLNAEKIASGRGHRPEAEGPCLGRVWSLLALAVRRLRPTFFSEKRNQGAPECQASWTNVFQTAQIHSTLTSNNNEVLRIRSLLICSCHVVAIQRGGQVHNEIASGAAIYLRWNEPHRAEASNTQSVAKTAQAAECSARTRRCTGLRAASPIGSYSSAIATRTEAC